MNYEAVTIISTMILFNKIIDKNVKKIILLMIKTYAINYEAMIVITRNIALRECIPPPAPLKIKIYDISAILWS